MAYVVAHYLRHSLRLQGKVYLVGMPGFGNELELQGIPFIGPGVRCADSHSLSDSIAGGSSGRGRGRAAGYTSGP